MSNFGLTTYFIKESFVEVVRRHVGILEDMDASNTNAVVWLCHKPLFIVRYVTMKRIPMVISRRERKKESWRLQGSDIILQVCTLAVPEGSGAPNTGSVTNYSIKDRPYWGR
jgi:hypothetical protein